MPTDPLPLPAGPFSAYLFDLDGTVADSMPLHFVAWTKTVQDHGGTFPEAVFYEFGGVPPLRVVELLNERFGSNMIPADVVETKEAMYLAELEQVQPIASVLAVIERDAGKIPFAIVSGSPRDSIVRTLKSLGLTHYFPVIVGAEDYAHGKPHPEPFIKAAELLGVAPETCLVFEDADAGIASAVAAGMQYVRVPPPNTTPTMANWPTAEKDEYKRLEGKKGESFDKDYITTMADDHAKDLADFNKERDSTANMELKATVSKGIEVIAGHKEMIDGMAQKYSLPVKK